MVFEDVPETACSLELKVGEHRRDADPSKASIPDIVQVFNDLTVLVAAEDELTITDPDASEIRRWPNRPA